MNQWFPNKHKSLCVSSVTDLTKGFFIFLKLIHTFTVYNYYSSRKIRMVSS